MTSKPVSALLADLGVTRSHSCPRVSNVNPVSGAQVKTLKYLPNFPPAFASLAEARQFCADFFYEYNYVHHHSGIAWHTPASVHLGLPTPSTRLACSSGAVVGGPWKVITDCEAVVGPSPR